MAAHAHFVALFAIFGTVSAGVAQSPDVSGTLAVQHALREGRDLLRRGLAAEAVQLLERQLPFINGNATYLSVLREAYGEYVKALQFEHKDDEAAEIQKRLQVLERGSAPPPNAVRAVRDDTAASPPQSKPDIPSSDGTLAEAERAFSEKRYRQAGELFALAFSRTAAVAKSHGPQWAYCKVAVVHERLSSAGTTLEPSAATELELEISSALNMAPGDGKLGEFAKSLRDDLRRRCTSENNSALSIKHADDKTDGWSRADTANFRLFHRQPRERAEQILRLAEAARSAAFNKWSGADRAAWDPVCDVYMHNAASEYARATKLRESSPGHATYQIQNGTVVRRRLDVRADEPSLDACVLPHEITHLALADLFADRPLPRWADEGMAILAEPKSQIERYARTLNRCRAHGELVHLSQLMGRSDYPEAERITAFYVESVSIVEFLTSERDPKTFVQFLRDAHGGRLDAALQKHYQCTNVLELESRWLRKLFPRETIRASSGK
jgi:hypothetical protein